MRRSIMTAISLTILGIGGAHYLIGNQFTSVSGKSISLVDSAAREQLRKYAEQEEADLKLGQYAINAMYKAGAKDRISDAKKQVLARAIVRISNDIFKINNTISM